MGNTYNSTVYFIKVYGLLVKTLGRFMPTELFFFNKGL